MMKIRINNKWSRSLIILSALFLLTPFQHEDRMSNGAYPDDVFASRELICAIELGNDMYGSHGLETGLNYELLRRFAADNSCRMKITASARQENYLDSLKDGKIDLLVTHFKDSLETYGLTALKSIDTCSVWAIRSRDLNEIRQFNRWISHIEATNELETVRKRFHGNYNPLKRAERGILTRTVSPYDSIIKEHSRSLGWDWRMVAAVVYQESKFSIASRSSRGAQGLMQVMPMTGKYYGVDNLLDPEQNITAGICHLKRLQDLFRRGGISGEELIKFTLAGYNAGEGRVSDCRNLARSKGYDDTIWKEVVKVIPLMREDSILEEESVKLGKFFGHETITYVESVLALHEAICAICPVP